MDERKQVEQARLTRDEIRGLRRDLDRLPSASQITVVIALLCCILSTLWFRG